MSLATTLQKVEECIERDVLDFFRLLGASEAPEDWDCPAAAQEGVRIIHWREFPQALRLGVRAVGWDSVEIEQWIADRRNDRA